MMALRPAPEPSGEYCTVAPWLAEAKPAFQASMAAPVEEAPMPVRVPVTLGPEAVGSPAGVVPVALSEPQAVSARAPAAITAIAAWRPKRSAFTRMYPFQGLFRCGQGRRTLLRDAYVLYLQ